MDGRLRRAGAAFPGAAHPHDPEPEAEFEPDPEPIAEAAPGPEGSADSGYPEDSEEEWDSTDHEEGSFAHFLHGLARWRYPALFAVTVALIGGTNATSLIYAGLAPTIWLPFAVARREVTFRDALAFVARTLLLTLAVSAWWITGLLRPGGLRPRCARVLRDGQDGGVGLTGL